VEESSQAPARAPRRRVILAGWLSLLYQSDCFSPANALVQRYACELGSATAAQALELVRALATHCPSVAEAAALWGAGGLPALLAHLRRGHDAGLREAAAAALDAVLRLHKAPAVREVLARGLRIRGLTEAYGARLAYWALAQPQMHWATSGTACAGLSVFFLPLPPPQLPVLKIFQ